MSGINFNQLAQTIANLPAGANLVSSDGTPVMLDGSQQIIIQSSGEEMSSIATTKESPAELQLRTFWLRQTDRIRSMRAEEFRHPELPLARIKKIMKLDEDVGMISSEAPVVLSKACEMFIEELTLRAWLHVEENKRRTLQRNDVATAVSKCDQFDFLIDIVPRDEVKVKTTTKNASRSVSEVQYFVQQSGQSSNPTVVQHHQQQQATAAAASQQVQVVTTNPQHQQALPEGATLPVMVNGPSGEVQQANLTLSPHQLEAIRNYIAQLGIPISGSNQIVIQAPTQGGNQLQVSINPQQLQAAQNSTDSE